MKKVIEILHLCHKQKLGTRSIAKHCGLSRQVVIDYLRRAEAAGIAWPLPSEMDESDLIAALYPPGNNQRPRPGFEKIHTELKRKGVTLRLLWEEYLSRNPAGFSYPRFCLLYREWARDKKIWMRQPHKAGEKLFIDYSGLTVPIIEPKIKAQIFVATLGASNFTYIEATQSQCIEDWIGSHVRAFEFFGGVPEILVPDNLKSGVTTADRYEPRLNTSYWEMAEHYGTAIIPARVRKPQDKGKVEKAVKDVEQRILAPLRDRSIFTLQELNELLSQSLKEFNNRPFQKVNGSRCTHFETIDKPALSPLPVNPYTYAEWENPRVGKDYHVIIQGHAYSVPYSYANEKVDVRITADCVDFFRNTKRIASHLRSEEGPATTKREHLAPGHRHYADCTPEQLLLQAGKIGPNAQAWAQATLDDTTRHLYERERSCLGALRLIKAYPQERLERAFLRAKYYQAYTCKNVASILKNNLDMVSPVKEEPSQLPDHEHIRGPNYYS